MSKDKKTRKMPKGMIETRVMPESFDAENNTLEVVFTTSAPVKRYDWFEGRPYFEILEMGEENVRLERLRAGAPVLNTHDQFRLEDTLGVVEGARLEGEQGFATLRLSERPEIKGLIDDIKAGILKNISVGYKIHKAVEEKNEETGVYTYRVTDWEPIEVSFVPVPADYLAQVRSEKNDLKLQSFDCEIITNSNKGEEMNKKDILQRNEDASNDVKDEEKVVDEVVETPVEEPAKEEEVVVEADDKKEDDAEVVAEAEKSAAKAERTRCIEVMEACRKHGMTEDFAKNLIDNGTSLKDSGQLILKELEKNNEGIKTNNVRAIEMGQDNVKKRMEAMTRGLCHVADPSRKLEDGDREFTAGSLLGAARMYLETEKGERNVNSLRPSEIAKKALHHSSDFPTILENVCNKFIKDGYSEVAATYQPFVRNRSVSDFKEVSESRLVGSGTLEKVNEHGEYKRTSLGSDGEKYRIHKFGEIIGVTEELLINDDLNAFSILPQELGAKVARTENELFWELVYTPQTMSDGVALFHADHGNLAGTPSAIDVASLSEARKAMRLQKDGGANGKRINIRPSYLVVPASLETDAEKFLTTISPNQATNVNPFGASMKLIVEPILEDASAKAWYAFGSLDQGPMAVKATLNGMGPQISVRNTWNIDGMETKIKYHMGMRIVDFRQFYKNAGV